MSNVKLSAILLAVSLVACGSAGSSADSDSSSEDLAKVTRFEDEASLKHVTIDGIGTDLLSSPDALRKGPFQDMQDVVGGYAFDGFTARLSASDLRKLTADPNRLARFADQMASGSADASSDVTIVPISRGDAVGALTTAMGGPKDQQAAFEKPLRSAVQSFLSLPTSAVYHATLCPDWCDEALIAVTVTGEIRTIHAFGDI
jgi:hypothetical protein